MSTATDILDEAVAEESVLSPEPPEPQRRRINRRAVLLVLIAIGAGLYVPSQGSEGPW